MEDIAVPRRRFSRRRVLDPEELIVSTISEHADSLLRVARRHTRCQDDAEDAYQRALEIFVKAAHRLDPSTVHKWLHTVVKHEAYAVCEQRAKYVGVDDHEALEALDDGRHVASTEERSERCEELSRAAEALKRLKPQEVTALVLKAQGLSYREIADRQGWTYTKVNRCITEGRRSFLERYAGIQSGAECARWLPILSAMADGEATAEQLLDVRPHLRNCSACRTVLGDMHRATAPVAALLPPALLGGAATPTTGILDRLGELVLGAQERIATPLVKAQSAVEAASSMKMAAVAASTVAIAGGGVAVERREASGDARAAEPSASIEQVRTTTAATPAEPAIATPPLRPATPTVAPAVEGPRRAQRTRAEPEPEPKPTTGAGPSAEFAPEVVAEPPASPAGRTSSAATPEPTGGGDDEFGFGG